MLGVATDGKYITFPANDGAPDLGSVTPDGEAKVITVTASGAGIETQAAPVMAPEDCDGETGWTEETADSMLAEAFRGLEEPGAGPGQPRHAELYGTPPTGTGTDPLTKVELSEFMPGSATLTSGLAASRAIDPGERTLTLFDELDTNQDGVLTRKEFAAREKPAAAHLAQSQNSVLHGAVRRKQYEGLLRSHIACQTEEAEVGDLKQLRSTVGETTTQLEGLQSQIAAAATAASQQFAKRMEEKVAVVQQSASDRLVYVEGKYEDALARARHAADTERTHELAKLRAEQEQSLLRLRAEYADRHTNETSHLLKERDEYKDKYENAERGMRLLRKDLGELQAVMARKTISKHEHDNVKAEAKKQRNLAEEYRKAEQAAIVQAKDAKARAQSDLWTAKKIEKDAKEATRKAVKATSVAQTEVEEAKRNATELVDKIGMELRVVKRLQETTARELENERSLRTIISVRQAAAISKVVNQNTKLKEQLKTVLRNTRPSKGAWVGVGGVASHLKGAAHEAHAHVTTAHAHEAQGHLTAAHRVGAAAHQAGAAAHASVALLTSARTEQTMMGGPQPGMPTMGPGSMHHMGGGPAGPMPHMGGGPETGGVTGMGEVAGLGPHQHQHQHHPQGASDVQWVEEKPAGEGVHSGVDTLGFSTQWKAYGQAGGGRIPGPDHPLATGFRPIPPPASRANGFGGGGGGGGGTPRAGGAVTERMRRAPPSGRRSGSRQTARAMTSAV